MPLLKKDIDKQILKQLESDHTFDAGFSLLIQTYQERLYWHIRRMVHLHADTDDILQNTFIKVFKNIKGFRTEAGLYTWMYRIATNETINFLNKKKDTVDLKTLNSATNQESKAAQYFDEDEAQILLKSAIEELPQKQKIIFNLRYYDEMPYKEMSEVLDTSIGALKASFHHAMNKVEQYLRDNYDYANG